MPELPEVETTLNGIRPYLQGQNLVKLVVRERKLRWPIQVGLESRISGQKIGNLQRRGKYILLPLSQGGLIIHLGMSGSMRVLLNNEQPEKHDHFDLVNEKGYIVRFRDPRKFGCLLYTSKDIYSHPRIVSLGVEPLSEIFNGEMLYSLSRTRPVSIKSFIMNSKVVVGIGNIYASEALFLSGIHPLRKSNNISRQRYQRLVDCIKQVLTKAIKAGGTTLQDFVGADSSPGYFKQELSVYGREGQFCIKCKSTIKRITIGQRSTFYCPACQR